MPEREYFSFRYAIPGYTFLLLVMAINYIPLLKILEITKAGSAFGAFLAFLSLFTGSAIGFLVSQIWYTRFSYGRRVWGIRGFETLRGFLIRECRKYGLVNEAEAPIGAILDYIRHRGKAKEISKYAERRWDMYHVLSSTLYALVIGFVLGVVFRIYYQISLFNASFSTCNVGFWAEFLAQLFILVCVVILILLIYLGRQRLMINYRPLLEAFLIYEIRKVGHELKDVFPAYFKETVEAEEGS